MDTAYSNILLKHFIEHYPTPDKKNVLSWYYNKYQLPSELWLYICDFLNLKNIILLSRCGKHIYNSLNIYISSFKKNKPIAFLNIYIKDSLHDVAYYNNHHQIPLFFDDTMKFFKKSNGVYVKFLHSHLMKSIYNSFKKFNPDDYICTGLEKHNIIELQKVCKTYSFSEVSSHIKNNNLHKYTGQRLIHKNHNNLYTSYASHFKSLDMKNTITAYIYTIKFILDIF